MDKIKIFLNKVIFEKRLEKVAKASLKSYLKDFFLIKNILFKLLAIIFCLIVCASLFFSLRNAALNEMLGVNPSFNSGAGFGIGKDAKQELVYFIKILISVIFCLLGIFYNRWYIYLPSLLISFNGWYNVIDKAIVDVFHGTYYWDTVVDYIYFAPNTKIASIANTADVFITIGVCLLFIGIVYYLVLMWKKPQPKEN